MMKPSMPWPSTPPATTEADAYVLGWKACMAGEDGRYTNPQRDPMTDGAWRCGWQDAMEAEDGEQPEPQCAGFGAAR